MALAYTIERLPEQVTVVFAGEADPTVADQFHTALLDAADPHAEAQRHGASPTCC